MKKRIITGLLSIVMLVSTLVVPAEAAGLSSFSDVTSQSAAVEIESLRMMGVLDGYSNGTFRPENHLTRAQFCKMATYVMAAGAELGQYRTVTIFPDVKPSHWASSYINLASKGKSVIAGYPDGKFYPERTVTVGQAVTILLRLLGYKDEEVGGIWPDSYMALGEMIGLTKGVGTDGNSPLTRLQAAKLFINLLQTQKKGGGTLYTLSEETELLAIDGGTGIMKTSDGKSYPMVHPVASTPLLGLRGRVVLDGSSALTFLPSSADGSGSASTAVVVYADHSSVGFDELAGNSTYQIYKNGSLATKNDLRKNDVATYYAATNSILVCDARVSVYYENCYPNPTSPSKITVLNGTELYVLPSARESLAAFKPGDQMMLLLTADGQVAAAMKPQANVVRSNAIGVVGEDGTIHMLCSSNTIQLAGAAPESYFGKVVRISSSSKSALTLTEQSGSIRGALNISDRTLGDKLLAENALIFENGQQIMLGSLTTALIREEQVKYARTNWAGEVDLIVLDRGTGELYGRVFWEITEIPVYDENGQPTTPEYDKKVGITYGSGSSDRVGPYAMNYNVRTGDYAAVKVNRGGNGFSMFIKLAELTNVPMDAWLGKTAVNVAGRTYEIPENVLCYNLDAQEWITLDEAFAYSDTASLFIKDGVVRIVEVAHN